MDGSKKKHSKVCRILIGVLVLEMQLWMGRVEVEVILSSNKILIFLCS